MPKLLDTAAMCGSGVMADLKETFDGDCLVTAVVMGIECIDPKGKRHMITYWDEDSPLSTSVGLAVVFHKAAMESIREVVPDDEDG